MLLIDSHNFLQPFFQGLRFRSGRCRRTMLMLNKQLVTFTCKISLINVQFYWLISTLLHCWFNNFGFTLGKPQSERKISDTSSFRPVPVQLWTFCTKNRQSKKWRNVVSLLERIWKIGHLYPGWSFVLSSRVICFPITLGWACGEIYLSHVGTRGVGQNRNKRNQVIFASYPLGLFSC